MLCGISVLVFLVSISLCIAGLSLCLSSTFVTLEALHVLLFLAGCLKTDSGNRCASAQGGQTAEKQHATN